MAESKDYNHREFLDQLKAINNDNKISIDELNNTDVGHCPICYEKLKVIIYENNEIKANPNITTTPCGHSFCFKCLSKHLETKNKCPICREKICDKQKYRLLSSYEGCYLINQKVDYHLADKINVINLASQQLQDPNILLSTVKYCMYDFMQTIRRFQMNDDSDDEDNL